MAKLVVFTGGTRSGKSRCAEQYAARLAAEVVYLATAVVGDAELAERVERHRRRRPATWRVVECAAAVGAALRDQPRGTVVLLDSLTLLVSYLLAQPAAEALLEQELDAMLTAQREQALHLIVVSDEVGWGVVPPTPLGRRFRDLLGQATQRLVAAADEAYLVVAGVPLDLRALQAAWSREGRP